MDAGSPSCPPDSVARARGERQWTDVVRRLQASLMLLMAAELAAACESDETDGTHET